MPVRDCVAWNLLVAGYTRNGLAEMAMEMVVRMQEEGERPDSFTLVSVLPACAHARALAACREQTSITSSCDMVTESQQHSFKVYQHLCLSLVTPGLVCMRFVPSLRYHLVEQSYFGHVHV